MYVKDWMTKAVYTVDVNDTIITAFRIMKDKKIKHLPVIENGKIVGIISDRKLKDYIPSKGTSLDVYELNYILENTKITEILNRNVITTTPNTPIEDAAAELMENRIGSLPVVDGTNLVGIISDRDIFKAMVDITGAKKGGYRITFILEDRSGTIRDAADIVRKYGFAIESILSGQCEIQGKRKVVVRSRGKGDGESMVNEIIEKYPDSEILFQG